MQGLTSVLTMLMTLELCEELKNEVMRLNILYPSILNITLSNTIIYQYQYIESKLARLIIHVSATMKD